MELRVLHYFLTVAREENITKAADVLHITQPTLSRQLMQLEEEVGAQLFKRLSRKIVLTHEGMLLRRRAEEIIDLVSKTEKELLAGDNLISGEIAFGAGELYAVEVLAPFLKSFQQKYPNVTFDLYTGNAEQIKERLDDGLCDIGLMLEPINIEKYEFIRLQERERWVILMPLDDPLTLKDFITPADLHRLPLIMVRRQPVRTELTNWLGSYYKDINIVFTSNMTTNAAIMVKNGFGYALVVEGSVSFWDKQQIAYRPLKPAITASTVICWKKHQPFSPAAEKFISYLKENLLASN